jgi:uncharacterized protein (TIGR03435 family)
MRTILALVLLGTAGFGQPAFEVASIKPREGPYGRIGVFTAGQRLTGEACMVQFLIMWAYDVKNFQVAPSAALAGLGNIPYDIAAKAEGEGAPTKAEFRAMLQRLLADRFKLKLHREMRETPVYGLAVGKSGPKFKEAPLDDSAYSRTSVDGRNYVLTMPTVTMDGLADMLMNIGIDRPVVDRTGLKGTYEIKLTYTPQRRVGRDEPDPGDLSVFTALQEQLGLRLVPQSASVEFLVVDHVEKPAGN